MRATPWALACGLALAACGGGGSDAETTTTGTAPTTPAATAVAYASSVTIGDGSVRRLDYTPASGATTPASVTATSGTAAPLLPVGSTPLVAEHVDAAYPGMRVACVSGRGETTGVVGPIDLGVIAQSAAVLLDAGWSPVADRVGAWSALAALGTELSGWENCGVKPEGLPSRSSRLVPQAAGGYAEDVYDGNPGTTYNVISRSVAPVRMLAMLSDAGDLDTTDPLRPLRLYWRTYRDAAGRRLWVQLGVPASGAAATASGFVALYTGA